jgi:hypothetical protein
VLTGVRRSEGFVTNWKDEGYRTLKNVVKYFYYFEDYCTSISQQ